jgi:hypothetical protein
MQTNVKDKAGRSIFLEKTSFSEHFYKIGASFCLFAHEEMADFKFFRLWTIYGMVFAEI